MKHFHIQTLLSDGNVVDRSDVNVIPQFSAMIFGTSRSVTKTNLLTQFDQRFRIVWAYAAALVRQV